MTKRGGDAEFTSQLFHVFFLGFRLVALPKLLDGVQFGGLVSARIRGGDNLLATTHRDDGSRTLAQSFVAFAIFPKVSCIQAMQFARAC